jgi:hypothetical protein
MVQSLMKCEVTDVVSQPRQAGSNTVREQEIWVHIPGKKHPQESKLSLWGNTAPLAAGEYVIKLADAVELDRFGALTLRVRPEHLSPVPAAKAS